MGCWSVYCSVSQIQITAGQEMYLLPLKKAGTAYNGYHEYLPATLPILGEYDDYGGIESIVEDENTKFIEKHFGVKIDEFCVFLIDGKFTYDRDEAKSVRAKLKKKKVLEEIEDWRFMFIDKQVYDFMSTHIEEAEKGHLSFGEKGILELIGFKFVKETKRERFNLLYEYPGSNDKFYSDGRWLEVGTKGENIFYFNGEYSSLEKYIGELPEDKKYLQETNNIFLWRALSERRTKEMFSNVLGENYNYFDDDLTLSLFALLKEKPLEEITNEDIEEHKKKWTPKPVRISQKYINQLDSFGDMLAGLVNMTRNFHLISQTYQPHKLYLTPQGGEYSSAQPVWDKFSEINRSYIHVEEE